MKPFNKKINENGLDEEESQLKYNLSRYKKMEHGEKLKMLKEKILELIKKNFDYVKFQYKYISSNTMSNSKSADLTDADLLIGFFRYYGFEHNYTCHSISLLDGTTKKKHSVNLDKSNLKKKLNSIEAEYQKQKDVIDDLSLLGNRESISIDQLDAQKESKKTLARKRFLSTIYPLDIQDPISTSDNCGRNMPLMHLEHIRSEMRRGYFILRYGCYYESDPGSNRLHGNNLLDVAFKSVKFDGPKSNNFLIHECDISLPLVI
ncbi:hypothetical protein AYI68_g6221 [Smittium mucronatum]|uniref:PAP-associated domain-containing protein n=1 Tax=Smittium mucronatum TaxID=133383 RepID=A0A1R0GS35_9FUNG|nr:hypothetical protein AYI68_g6221 [Smittium mucronatum]